VRIIRTGVTRTVILAGPYAIKVPTLRPGMSPDHRFRDRLGMFARGLLANQSEYTWSRFGPWAGQVAPVRHSFLGGIVQVYPRCAPVPAGAVLPVLDPDPGDDKADNYGWLHGRVVRVDYDMS